MSLQAHQLSCQRGGRLLFTDLNFEVQAGGLLRVEGRNGCGKTTLLKTLASLRQPDAGSIHWQGQPIAALGEEYRRETVWLGHQNGIKGDLTALENLRIGCTLHGAPATEQERWQALATIGLYGYEDVPTRVLSQGQQRRVALAWLLLVKARLWILDEPFTALDKAAQTQLQSVLQGHLATGGMVVLTTHQAVDLAAGHIGRLQLGTGDGC